MEGKFIDLSDLVQLKITFFHNKLLSNKSIPASSSEGGGREVSLERKSKAKNT